MSFFELGKSGKSTLPIASIWKIVICWLACCCQPVAAENGNALAEDGSTQLPQQVTFNAHIRPIMSNTCFTCHGPDEEDNESGFRIDSFAAATSPLPADNQKSGIVPGQAMQSEVYLRITGQSAEGEVMPPADFRHTLTGRDKELFRRWIEQGAKYEQHWAYAPLKRPQVPTPKDSAWGANPIDAFILDRLENEGLAPTHRAKAAQLLRRVTLDLIGLPPTAAELQQFLSDSSPQAYERAVDRLLASPHFGERMASYWLDIVRFADTVGFHGDQNQRIFPYRDYVIDAFNDNMPFDQFTREQIAGDLLPHASDQQLVATGFLRLNMMTREGGAQTGEYLAKYRADRVRALGTAWLGATLACCECHNHKYDPFTARDFYSFGAFFDDLRQWGVYSDYGYTPTPDLKGFNNDYPFPPEIRVESKSLQSQIERQSRLRDQALFREFHEEVEPSEEFVAWRSEVGELLRNWPTGWVPLEVKQVTTSAADEATPSVATVKDDGSILLAGQPQKKETVTIETRLPVEMPMVALRIEVLPDEQNGGLVGRAGDGRFEITKFEVSLSTEAEPKPLQVAWAQADRSDPGRYSNGRAPNTLGGRWKSGPARCNCPATKRPCRILPCST